MPVVLGISVCISIYLCLYLHLPMSAFPSTYVCIFIYLCLQLHLTMSVSKSTYVCISTCVKLSLMCGHMFFDGHLPAYLPTPTNVRLSMSFQLLNLFAYPSLTTVTSSLYLSSPLSLSLPLPKPGANVENKILHRVRRGLNVDWN